MSTISSKNLITHIDADSFFVSCERVRSPSLKNIPVAVVSKVGGIVLAKSYEAKAKGVKTGMPTWKALAICSNLVIRKADMELYAQLSKQMFDVLSSISPRLEKRSIDEGYSDLYSAYALSKMSPRQKAEFVQSMILKKTGLPVSIGIAPSKTLAKIASDYNKPFGIKVVKDSDIRRFLKTVKVEDIPGIGRRSYPRLIIHNINTAYDFINTSMHKIKSILHTPGVQIWYELQGIRIWDIEDKPNPQQSIIKSASFPKLNNDKDYIFSELVHNLNRAVMKLHKLDLVAKEFQIFLRDNDHVIYQTSKKLFNYTDNSHAFLKHIRCMFETIWDRGKMYRSSGIEMDHLVHKHSQNLDFFHSKDREYKLSRLENTLSQINHRYGSDAIFIASELHTMNHKPTNNISYQFTI